jgi:crotonobetainyl-CoA:carnitine CoA-transferase CaiB-like acyl-CoA transferase
VKAEIPEQIARFSTSASVAPYSAFRVGDGEYVLYSDHLAKVEELSQERDEYREDWRTTHQLRQRESKERDHAEQLIAEAREGIQKRLAAENEKYHACGEFGDLDGCRVHGAAVEAYREAAQFLASQGGEEE